MIVGCSSTRQRTALPPVTTAAPPPPASTVPTTVALPPRPYPVATIIVPIVDASRPTVSRGRVVSSSRSLTTKVWYPAVGAGWPLMVFAPGYRVGPSDYAHMLAAWAAAGYVVAAPEFPLGDATVAGTALDENDLQNEPSDVRFVMAGLIGPSSPIGSHIDPLRMGVAGHSDGAEAALAVAQQGDVTIRAAIAMSAQPVVPHLAANPPLLVAQGDGDTINPPARAQAVFDQATRPRFLLVLEGAGHLEPFAGGSRWQPAVDRVTIDFLDRYVAGITDSVASLLADGQHPGLSHLLAAP